MQRLGASCRNVLLWMGSELWRSQSQLKVQQGAFVPMTATHDDCAQCSVLRGLCLTLSAGGAIGKDDEAADAVY